MENTDNHVSKGPTRREALKFTALSLGGLMLGQDVVQAGHDEDEVGNCYPVSYKKTQRYKYFSKLKKFYPGTPIGANEMRITFMGSAIPPVRSLTHEMSIYVEVGNAMGEPDQFVFDCGCGVCNNYCAMQVPYSKMNKLFISHLHVDHMSDLAHIYAFGAAADRKSPLFVFGPGNSGVPSPTGDPAYYDDGTWTFCDHLRKALRWQTEAFSFLSTSYATYQPPSKEDWGLPVEPVPVGDDLDNDAFAMIPIELDWTKSGKEMRADGSGLADNVAYYNQKSGVKITHFPVIHNRKGSIGYKLEWNGLSMIYTSDTKPETESINQAINGGKGVDVFIHEMVTPAEIWTMKMSHLTEIPDPATDSWTYQVEETQTVEDSSHSPQGAFGHVLNRINPRPKLTVATHFPSADDTIDCAFRSVQAHCQEQKKIGETLTWSFDLMVLSVTQTKIQQLRGVVNEWGYPPIPQMPPPDEMNTPRYWKWAVDENGQPILDDQGNQKQVSDPFAQLDLTTWIPPENEDGTINYRDDGY